MTHRHTHVFKHTKKESPMTTETKEIVIKETVTTLADKIAPHITIEDGKPVLAKDTFEATLPETLTLKTVKEVQTHINTFEAAANLAVGQAAITYFESNPDAQAVMVSTKVGKETYHAAVARMQSVSTGIGSPRKDVFGNITSGIKSSNSDAKAVNLHVRSIAERLRQG